MPRRCSAEGKRAIEWDYRNLYFSWPIIAGSGGYSSRAAWLNTTLLDTKTGTEIGVTIATGREKWKTPYGYRSDWNSYDFGLGVPVLVGP